MDFLVARETWVPREDSQFRIEKWVPEEDFFLRFDGDAPPKGDGPWAVVPYYLSSF
ncbi:MAG: hypothetical protein WCG29_14185 [Desulfomonile sp.]